MQLNENLNWKTIVLSKCALIKDILHSAMILKVLKVKYGIQLYLYKRTTYTRQFTFLLQSFTSMLKSIYQSCFSFICVVNKYIINKTRKIIFVPQRILFSSCCILTFVSLFPWAMSLLLCSFWISSIMKSLLFCIGCWHT